MTQPEHAGAPADRIARFRLANHGIANPTFAQPGDVVTWLGAVQAQDFGGALWAIGLRMTRTTERGIEQAIADRAIVRTWPMRGTLHFVAPQDVRWLLALLTPRVIAQSAGRYRQLELDEATFTRGKEVFAKALQGRRQLTRDEMLQALEQAGISTAGQRGYYLLGRSAQDGLICHGPATVQDLMHWAGLTAAEANTGLATAGKALIRETIADRVYWMPCEAPQINHCTPSVHLLPGFDEYLLGYRDRSAVLDPAHAQRICPGGNGMFNPTIVIDGVVTGTWKRTFKGGAVVIETTPFRPLTAAEGDALGAAADRYGRFLGLPAVLLQA
jgi:hypothetical protein